jgi:uncharacterized membrane protein
MSDPGASWTEDQFDLVLAHVLRAGVLLAARVVAAGGAMFVLAHGAEPPQYRVFRGEPASLRSVHAIVVEAMRLRAEGIVQLGLLLLIATPIARVVFSVIGFVKQRDWLYVGITAAVLALLTYSLLSG